MNSITRVAIALFGLFLLVQGLATCTATATGFLRYQDFAKNRDWFSDWLLAAGLSAGTVVLLALVPALLLLGARGRIADRLFPETSMSVSVTPSSVHSLGCTLLALFFIIKGAAGLVGGLVATISLAFSETGTLHAWELSQALDSVGTFLVELIAGLLLYRHAHSRPSYGSASEPAA